MDKVWVASTAQEDIDRIIPDNTPTRSAKILGLGTVEETEADEDKDKDKSIDPMVGDQVELK